MLATIYFVIQNSTMVFNSGMIVVTLRADAHHYKPGTFELPRRNFSFSFLINLPDSKR